MMILSLTEIPRDSVNCILITTHEGPPRTHLALDGEPNVRLGEPSWLDCSSLYNVRVTSLDSYRGWVSAPFLLAASRAVAADLGIGPLA